MSKKRIVSGSSIYPTHKGIFYTNDDNVYSKKLNDSIMCSPHKELIRKHCLICDLEYTQYYIFPNTTGVTRYGINIPVLLKTLWHNQLGRG